MTGFPLEDVSQIENLVAESIENSSHFNSDILINGPQIYHATFDINASNEIHDTYINPQGWGKVC